MTLHSKLVNLKVKTVTNCTKKCATAENMELLWSGRRGLVVKASGWGPEGPGFES